MIEKFKKENPELYTSLSMWFDDETILKGITKPIEAKFVPYAKMTLNKVIIKPSIDKLDDELIIK